MGSYATISGGKPYDLYLSSAGSCVCSNTSLYYYFYKCSTGPCTTTYDQPAGYLACAPMPVRGAWAIGWGP